MTLRQQAFLPMVGPDNRIHGVLAVTSATYNGNETTVDITINSVAQSFPVKRMTYDTNVGALSSRQSSLRVRAPVTGEGPRNVDYMAIALSASDVRQYWSKGQSQRLVGPNGDSRYWIQAAGFKMENYGGLFQFLLGGGSSFSTNAAPTTPTGSNVTKTFTANAPFTNAPECQFIDINWQVEAAASLTPFTPLSVSVGAQSADPSGTGILKAAVVQSVSPNIVGGVINYSTIRVIRTNTAAVATGTYTWPLTFTNASGGTLTVNLNVVVS